ncbi:hypothetical protein [Clostridium vitabionis]|uniref:hypothetical protein n=1 Tax=Clostridium vitabionis TaxID=2784388 RepID=UPI00188B9627|nr:hypothetical protein [Clostridium vitabionis]
MKNRKAQPHCPEIPEGLSAPLQRTFCFSNMFHIIIHIFLKINDQIVDPVHEGADGENIQKNIGWLGKTVCVDDYNTSNF